MTQLEDKENNRNYANMAKISDYEMKEPIKKKKNTNSKLLLNNSSRDMNSSTYKNSKKSKKKIQNHRLFNPRSSSNPHNNIPKFQSKKSLIEYSTLITQTNNPINMSKRSSTAANAYGIDLSRREMVKMFKKGQN